MQMFFGHVVGVIQQTLSRNCILNIYVCVEMAIATHFLAATPLENVVEEVAQFQEPFVDKTLLEIGTSQGKTRYYTKTGVTLFPPS